MSNSDVISTVSHQWASRPDDQRFLSMSDLYDRVSARRRISGQRDVAIDSLRINATDEGEIELLDTRGENFGQLTNWTFSQLCAKAHAPAGYLRSLPAELAQIPLQYSLELQAADDAKLLTRRTDGVTDVAAITGPAYGRIWDADVIGALSEHVDLNVWKVPGASYASKDPKRASTLYASDRDVFVFLVNESQPIEVDGETMFRGMYCWNSETGSATFGIATMLYRYVCDNRNIWGPKEFKQITMRHTSGAPHRFDTQVTARLQAYANAGTAETVQTIQSARAREVGKDKKSVTKWLQARGFSVPVSTAAYDNAENDGLNPRTVWGLVQGLTEQAHAIGHTDDRVALERKAGALLDVVAA